jgi:hypothetical protein
VIFFVTKPAAFRNGQLSKVLSNAGSRGERRLPDWHGGCAETSEPTRRRLASAAVGVEGIDMFRQTRIVAVVGLALTLAGTTTFGTCLDSREHPQGTDAATGVVDNESDKTVAGMRAREVPGSFGVESELVVENQSKSTANR